MVRRVETTGDGAILYDDALLSHPDPALFEPVRWAGAPRPERGRGTVLFISHEGRDWVLRHYHRGGLAARLSDDRFLWTGPDRTRAFREWRLLAELVALGLPAPRPVAARYRRHGSWYTADLVTARLRGVRPLSAVVVEGSADEGLWRAVGACIARFHARGVYHADLNAHNVQVDEAGAVWLLDFDRGRLRGHGERWRDANLERLKRSLAKLRRQEQASFAGQDWQWLLDSYREARRMRLAAAAGGP